MRASGPRQRRIDDKRWRRLVLKGDQGRRTARTSLALQEVEPGTTPVRGSWWVSLDLVRK
jgi:hypothetical protein